MSSKKLSWHTGVWNFDSNNSHHLLRVLLLSGQVETNPGPPPFEFPCGISKNEVNDSANALCCDMCSYWCHIDCCGVSSENYQNLCNNSNSFSWICYQCGCLNFNSLMFATASIELSNSFSALDSSESHDLDLLTQPQTSTPNRQSTMSYLVPPKNRVS